MWRKKLASYRWLAGLTLLIGSCTGRQAVVKLRTVKELPHFPSASAIEYIDQKLVVFGDDASYALVLDTAFHEIDTIRYLPDTSYRIHKDQKPDVESATLRQLGGAAVLMAFGSMSTPNRHTAFVFPAANLRQFTPLSLSPLTPVLRNIRDLNIEGAAFVAGKLVLANRAHLGNQTSQLALINSNAPEAGAHIITIRLKQTQAIAGISGLYYLASRDRLLFTASEEATASTQADGAIGNSYIGWFDRFTERMQQQLLWPDGFVPLQNVDRRLAGKKIEGICATQGHADSTTLVLTADNDDGRSTLFKVVLFD